jgi:4-hydroxy-3-methylbut-2-enyl diphosphate reductase IspH
MQDSRQGSSCPHGAPIYVRHEVVHNKFVVDSLKTKGAIFVEEIDEVPANLTYLHLQRFQSM